MKNRAILIKNKIQENYFLNKMEYYSVVWLSGRNALSYRPSNNEEFPYGLCIKKDYSGYIIGYLPASFMYKYDVVYNDVDFFGELIIKDELRKFLYDHKCE